MSCELLLGKVMPFLSHMQIFFWKKNPQKKPEIQGSVGKTDTKPSKAVRE